MAEILRRNFAEPKPCPRARTDRRMQSQHETRPENSGNNNSNEDDIVIDIKSSGDSGQKSETRDAGTENELTLSSGRVEYLPEALTNDTEHVYCTVYCIEVDEEEERKHGTSSQEEEEEGQDSDLGSSPQVPTLYTLDDLVDPFGDLFNRLYGTGLQARTEAPVQSCRVCLEEVTPASLSCCRKAVCEECLRLYVSSQVRVGKVHISCPIPECSGYLEEGVVVSHLAKEDVGKYHYFLELSQLDSSTKPCPQCSQFTSLKEHNQNGSEHKYKIQCSNCQFIWCFKCHAPWHNGIKCRDYRKGDKLLRNWASVIEHGQRNAQKCPHCKIHIQRTEGCDHMTCTQCNTNFCYRCGERYRHLRFFGDHTSNLSVFGCKYRYLPDKPHLRRFIRGSVCATKVLIAPVVLLLVVVFGALALVIGLVAFPVYYVCKRRKKQHTRVSGRWI